MHAQAFDFVKRSLATVPRRRMVVEIGGRNINGTIRELFPGVPFIATDIAPGRGVDAVEPGETYDPPAAPDTVVCCEVFEHTDAAAAIVANAHRMLEAGGVFIATMATDPRAPHSAGDGGALRDGEYYGNVDTDALREWLRPFIQVRIEVHRDRGDLYCYAEKRGA
jgi:SAM-dependent methyltransferase